MSTTTWGALELIAEAMRTTYPTYNAAIEAVGARAFGQLTHDYTSDADYTLSTSTDPGEWQYGVIRLTDTGPVLTTGRALIWPAVNHRAPFLVINATAQTITVKRSGGTGVAVASGSTRLLRDNGTDVEDVIAAAGSGTWQPLDALLTAIAALTTSADQLIYSTGSDAVAMTALTAFARTLLDDADAATARATLGAEAAVQNNLSGSGAPGVNDDSSAGYAPRSRWFDVAASPPETYVCVDASVGAAQWVKTSLTLDELGALAAGNDSDDVPNASNVSGTTTSDALDTLQSLILMGV